ncbi:MAG: flagellar assembly protein FliW [Halobacteriovoraceae bacterium]|nr:flagellar assembly protein FliW [Halobacteriovoraceae bacterium]
MKVNTTRFGELEVDKKDIIRLKEGLLGFDELTSFFIVDPNDQTLILWLQSTERPEIAFPILEPRIFVHDYKVNLLPAEMASLELENLNQASIYSILTIPQNVTDMSANLKAPLVINNQKKIARQIVLQDSKLEVKHPMYTDLKKYIVSFSSDDTKRTNVQRQRTQTTIEETTTENAEIKLPEQNA